MGNGWNIPLPNFLKMKTVPPDKRKPTTLSQAGILLRALENNKNGLDSPTIRDIVGVSIPYRTLNQLRFYYGYIIESKIVRRKGFINIWHHKLIGKGEPKWIRYHQQKNMLSKVEPLVVKEYRPSI